MGPRDFETADILRRDGRRCAEMAAASLTAGQRPVGILANGSAAKKARKPTCSDN